MNTNVKACGVDGCLCAIPLHAQTCMRHAYTITSADVDALHTIVCDYVAIYGITESIATYTRLLHKYTAEFAQTTSATNYRLVEKCMLALQDLHGMRDDLRQRNRMHVCTICHSANKTEYVFCDNCGATLAR